MLERPPMPAIGTKLLEYHGRGQYGYIVRVRRYAGRYTQWFTWDVTVTSSTPSGVTTMCI